MDDAFKIYVEQLREGREKELDETFDPAFLEVNEKDLQFTEPVKLTGKAYLAEDELILHWTVNTQARIPCTICNQLVTVPIEVENVYHSIPLEEIKTGIYHLNDLLRETILLEIPAFTECHGGRCPKRQEFTKYFKKPSEDQGYHPFADLNWKE